MSRRMTAEQVWARVDRRGPDECWPWTGQRSVKGYGRVRWDGRSARANRVVYELDRGPIPTGLLICHTCDNPPCVNPAHLFLGTSRDNMVDSVRKGRHQFAKLTPELVAAIRAAAEAGASQRSLAAKYGVGRTTIQTALQRKTWAHVA